MPRVTFVKKAQKDDESAGIKKGDSYYWWKFPFSGIRKSKTPPKPSQLTQSAFKSAMCELEERIGNLTAGGNNIDDLRSEIESIAEDIRALGEEQTEKKSNMPEGLQEGSTGELLENRANECEEMAGQLDSIDLDTEELGEGATAEETTEYEERLQQIVDEAQGISYGGD